jgi:hypothetical protein
MVVKYLGISLEYIGTPPPIIYKATKRFSSFVFVGFKEENGKESLPRQLDKVQ